MKRPARLVLRTILNLTLIYCLFLAQTAFAAPDPRDSVIIESKTVGSGVGHPAAYVRIFITNKDTLALCQVTLVERSLTGGAYMLLPQPLDFDVVIHPLTTTLQGFPMTNGDHYNGASPDTISIVGIYQPMNNQSAERPNLARKPLWDLKFDTVKTNIGTIELDSALLLFGEDQGNVSRVNFVDLRGNEMDVNFVKGIITVQAPEPPCFAQKFDMKENGVPDMVDVVLLLNCAFLGKGDCKGVYTSADVVILLNAVFLGIPLPPGTC